MNKKINIGILAHVDAGKTTLSESMLYLSGKLKKPGRVDTKDAFLDTFDLERARGITIFSKQALFKFGQTEITLLDTPGHVDFSAEMERTLQVLDYAILVISGADGVQGHTKTLWRLLEIYAIPVFIFVNKMDQKGTDRNTLIQNLQKDLTESCIPFDLPFSHATYEQLALCDEALMETYLDTGHLSEDKLKNAILERRIFPCFFGSALKNNGVESILAALDRYTLNPSYPSAFSARVYKITRDEQGNRLTHLKVMGGQLNVRDIIRCQNGEEKINQIRIYAGQKYEAISTAYAGTLCAVTGLTQTRPGEGLGTLTLFNTPILEPVLSYTLHFSEDVDARLMFPKLLLIEEELPELRFKWDETHKQIHAQLMGEVQIEILQSLIESRYGVTLTLGEGAIVYKETLLKPVEGVGHFEPLRHYAEVHLLMAPSDPGSGLTFETDCSEDLLAKNWQRLILSHLEEKSHKGVLTGSEITDLHITVVAGKAHNKHTEGGDFREATYRAVRQGLKEGISILLEPFYAFQLELPEKMVGRAMTDIESLHGSCEITYTDGENVVLSGSGPVATLRNYQKEVIAYTKGHGRFFATFKGYAPCHNTDEVLIKTGYDSERDLENPTGSVFCTHGSGYHVPWDEVKNHMHVAGILPITRATHDEPNTDLRTKSSTSAMSLEEIDQIIQKTFYANQGDKTVWKKKKTARESYYESVSIKRAPLDPTAVLKEEYLLVDGYNIIFAWDDLKAISEDHLEAARMKLLDILSNYQSIRKCEIIVVFDAYRVEGRREEVLTHHNIHVVFTSEAQTADQYIEKFTHLNREKYKMVVATSDALQQMIVRGAGSSLLSARELKEAIETANQRLMLEYNAQKESVNRSLSDSLSPEMQRKIDALKK